MISNYTLNSYKITYTLKIIKEAISKNITYKDRTIYSYSEFFLLFVVKSLEKEKIR